MWGVGQTQKKYARREFSAARAVGPARQEQTSLSANDDEGRYDGEHMMRHRGQKSNVKVMLCSPCHLLDNKLSSLFNDGSVSVHSGEKPRDCQRQVVSKSQTTGRERVPSTDTMSRFALVVERSFLIRLGASSYIYTILHSPNMPVE